MSDVSINSDRLLTLADLFDERVRQSPSRIAYRQYLDGVDRWHGYTWSDVQTRVNCWQAALVTEGLKPGERVAIMSANRPDWVAVDIAALSLGLVTVALFTGDTPGNSAHTLKDSGASLLVVEQADWWLDMLEHHDLPDLRRVVSLSAGMPHQDARAVNLSTWLPQPEDTRSPPRLRRPAADDLAVICYTSGTTGSPKGVMLTHHNILSNVLASHDAVPLRADDVALSFLPMAHMFERTAGYYHAMFTGTEVAFTRGIEFLREDFADVQPTVMISVPRIFERYYAVLQRRLQRKPLLQRMLARWTVAVGWQRHLREQGRGGSWLAARVLWPVLRQLFARPMLAGLGGRMRVAISGGAPLAPEISHMFVALGWPVLQGYGLTEAGPVVSSNREDDNDPESVGRPLVGVETKVGHNSELLVRGPSVMRGYWNDPETTATVLSADGWLSTGDKVSRLQSDRIFVTGRLKELIVMSNGEKASPLVIEQLLLADPLIDQIMVVGEARPYLVALVVPETEALTELGETMMLDTPGVALEGELLSRCSRRLAQLPKFAQVRRIGVVDEPWTVGNEMATPTMKLRRRRIMQSQSTRLDQLYSGHFVAPVTEAGYHVDIG